VREVSAKGGGWVGGQQDEGGRWVGRKKGGRWVRVGRSFKKILGVRGGPKKSDRKTVPLKKKKLS
jgi:hypothetical protein